MSLWGSDGVGDLEEEARRGGSLCFVRLVVGMVDLRM